MTQLRPYFDGKNLILSGATLPDIPLMAARAAPQLGLRYLNGDVELAQFLGEAPAETRERLGSARLKLELMTWLEMTVLRRDMLLSIAPSLLLLGDALPRLRPTGIVLVPHTSLDEALSARHRAWGERYHDRGQRAILLEALRGEEALRGKDGVETLALNGLPLAERVERVIAFWRARR